MDDVIMANMPQLKILNPSNSTGLEMLGIGNE